jgi:hypothetical protein
VRRITACEGNPQIRFARKSPSNGQKPANSIQSIQ